MKLKNFLKYFNEGILIEVYNSNGNSSIYRGEICDIPNKLLDCELDSNEYIDTIVEMDCYTVLEIYIK